MATKQKATGGLPKEEKTTGFTFGKWTPKAETTALEEKANSYGEYKDGDSVIALRDKMNQYETNNNPGAWDESQFQAVTDARNAWQNRGPFSYDLNGDALYQQYKDKFVNQGRLAMADTIGQASAMTGGYGSSYAVTAGNQAYQSSLQNLNDIVPQLYQMAYDRYVQQGEDLKTNYSMLSNEYQTKYGEHMDKLNLYQTELARLTDAYNNERSFDYGKWDADRNYYATAYNNQYNRDYGEFADEQTNAFNAYQQGVNEEIQRAQLKLQQDAAQKASVTESFKGLSFEDSEVLQGFYQDQDWDGINRYITSLNLSAEDTAKLAKIWLPDSYLNPLPTDPPKTPNYMGGGGRNVPMHTLN